MSLSQLRSGEWAYSAAGVAWVTAVVVTRPVEDSKDEAQLALKKVVDLLEKNHMRIAYKSNIHQKFAIIDQKTVWYGSINLLSYGSAQESIMRIESSNIANELIKSIEPLLYIQHA